MSLSSQLRKLELVRVNECEQVDGVGVRLRGLISRVALRRRRPLPSKRTRGPPPLNVNSGLGSGGGFCANKPRHDSICATLPPPTTRKMSTSRVELRLQIDASHYKLCAKGKKKNNRISCGQKRFAGGRRGKKVIGIRGRRKRQS